MIDDDGEVRGIEGVRGETHQWVFGRWIDDVMCVGKRMGIDCIRRWIDLSAEILCPPAVRRDSACVPRLCESILR